MSLPEVRAYEDGDEPRFPDWYTDGIEKPTDEELEEAGERIEESMSFIEQRYGDTELDEVVYGTSDEVRGMIVIRESDWDVDEDVMIVRAAPDSYSIPPLVAHEYGHGVFFSAWRDNEDWSDMKSRWAHLLYEGHGQHIDEDVFRAKSEDHDGWAKAYEDVKEEKYHVRSEDDPEELIDSDVLRGQRRWEQDEDPLFGPNRGYRIGYSVVDHIIEEHEVELEEIPRLDGERARNLVIDALGEIGPDTA